MEDEYIENKKLKQNNQKYKMYDILNLIEEKHIDMYFNISKKELDKYINEIIKKYEINDDYDLYYYTNMIIKKIFGIYDSHTKLLFEKGDFYLPVRLKYINNKLYIIRTTKETKTLLYSEVKKIENIDINIIIEEIKSIVASSTEEYVTSQIELFLINGYKIKSLPSIDSKLDEFNFTVNKDEKIIDMKLTKDEGYLLPVNKPKENYSYELKDDKIIIVYNKCREEYDGQMIEFVNKIESESKKFGIEKFIVDIRGNQGGNSEIINPLIEFLKDKKTVTLVDEYVFSGGRFAILDLKNINSKFVGTGIGTQLNCFGNAPITKYDNFIIPISNKYFYMDTSYSYDDFRYADTKEKFKKLKQNKELFVPQIFEPDYYSKKNIDDYKVGFDRELEFAIELLKEEKLQKGVKK